MISDRSLTVEGLFLSESVVVRLLLPCKYLLNSVRNEMSVELEVGCLLVEQTWPLPVIDGSFIVGSFDDGLSFIVFQVPRI